MATRFKDRDSSRTITVTQRVTTDTVLIQMEGPGLYETVRLSRFDWDCLVQEVG